MSGVDALTGTYRLPCPRRGESRVHLSSFREIARLDGPAHPAVYRIVFECGCGEEHVALVGHDALDWAPLGLDDAATFVNLMTSRSDGLATELVALASARIDRGEWPWSFYCYLEDTPRPVTPSSFRLVDDAVGRVALAVSCPRCGSTSVNLVTRPHVDIPFHSDPRVGVLATAFEDGSLRSIDGLRAELVTAAIDDKCLELHG